MEFYDLIGKTALGSRLRRLQDMLKTSADRIYSLYGIEIDGRWFPVLYMLSQKESCTVTELAESIGQTHPAVSQVVRAMSKKGLVESEKCTNDARVTRVTLSTQGQLYAQRLQFLVKGVDQAISNIFTKLDSNLWKELQAFEKEIEDKSLHERVAKLEKQNLNKSLKIVPFEIKYKNDFKSLNVSWIEKYWTMEEGDYKSLNNPEEYILQPGGSIAIALYNDRPVGTCALIKLKDGEYELAKMAVDESTQGLGIGYQLGLHIIEAAKELGAHRLYLGSNTVLESALHLYRKLGFQVLEEAVSPYERCNIEMELIF